MKLLVSVFAALACTCTAFALGQGTFDRTLPISGPVHLDVRSDVGGITLTVGPSESVQIHAILRPQYGPLGLARAEAHIRALEQNPPIEQTGNRIRIGYPKDPNLLAGVSMHLDIEAPRESQIEAHTSSGGIRVDGIRGPVEARTHSGRIEVRAISGNVRAITHSGAILIQAVGSPVFAQNDSGGIQVMDSGAGVDSQTDSGRIEISGAAGKVSAATHSGRIVIHKVNSAVFARNHSGRIEAEQVAGAIDAQTGSGAIRLSQAKPAPIHARSDSGAIRVKLASGAGYAVVAHSEHGKISIPAMQAQTRMKHYIKGKMGSGGPIADISTDSSKIWIN